MTDEWRMTYVPRAMPFMHGPGHMSHGPTSTRYRHNQHESCWVTYFAAMMRSLKGVSFVLLTKSAFPPQTKKVQKKRPQSQSSVWLVHRCCQEKDNQRQRHQAIPTYSSLRCLVNTLLGCSTAVRGWCHRVTSQLVTSTRLVTAVKPSKVDKLACKSVTSTPACCWTAQQSCMWGHRLANQPASVLLGLHWLIRTYRQKSADLDKQLHS